MQFHWTSHLESKYPIKDLINYEHLNSFTSLYSEEGKSTTSVNEEEVKKENWLLSNVETLMRTHDMELDYLNARNIIDNPLCSLLRGKSILFIGDSLSSRKAASLHLLMGGM